MANIVITSDADYIAVTYNDKAVHVAISKIRRSAIRQVDCLTGGDGVMVVDSSTKGILLKYSEVDEVNTDTDITSDAILFGKLKDLM